MGTTTLKFVHTLMTQCCNFLVFNWHPSIMLKGAMICSAFVGTRALRAFSSELTAKAQLFDQYEPYLRGSFRKAADERKMREQARDFFIPLYSELLALRNLKKEASGNTFMIGISAPQGCGKTTATEYLRLLFEVSQKSCFIGNRRLTNISVC